MASKIKNLPSLLNKIEHAARSNDGKMHIIPYSGKWAVKREGTTRASYIVSTIDQAIEKARNNRHFAGLIVLHSKDGSTQHLSA